MVPLFLFALEADDVVAIRGVGVDITAARMTGIISEASTFPGSEE